MARRGVVGPVEDGEPSDGHVHGGQREQADVGNGGNGGTWRHCWVDWVRHHSADGVLVDTSGGVGDDCHGVEGHLGDDVCQLGGGTGAGQDEEECEARLHALAANIFILLPQVALFLSRAP